ncbi:MAG: glycine cleavage system protein GcvH [Synechococcus sp. Tobar2m-G35]|jgi:glycine cleavage system H protein|nr:glycine cleavage system protein GcvH [Synechococcus sp. Tobar2m-G35]
MALEFPADLRYADSHEYAAPAGIALRVGISAFAVDQLGDIVFVELPAVGQVLERGASFGTVESVKAVEEMYAPVSGVVTARNDVVIERPELLQQDPYGEGWLLEVEPTDPGQIEDLMAADAYRSKVEGA